MKQDAEQSSIPRSSQALVGLFIAAALTATVAGCAPRSNAVPGQSHTTYIGTGSTAPSGSGSGGAYCPDRDNDWECDDGSGSIDHTSTAAYYQNGVGYYSRSSGVSNGARAVPPPSSAGGTTNEIKPASPSQTQPTTSSRAGTFTSSGSVGAVSGDGTAGSAGAAGDSSAGETSIKSGTGITSGTSGGSSNPGGSFSSGGSLSSSHGGIGSSSSSSSGG